MPRSTLVELSAAGAEALARFVSRAYARDASGAPIDLGPGLYPGSRFYAATGRYSLFHTCNSWIAEALRARRLPDHAGLGPHRAATSPSRPAGAGRPRGASLTREIRADTLGEPLAGSAAGGEEE